MPKQAHTTEWNAGSFSFAYQEPGEAIAEDVPAPQKRSAGLRRKGNNIYRRAFSETQLLDLLNLNMQDGESYHLITGGDVDSLSLLKVILRQLDLDYCLFSTWCMAKEDICQLSEWIDQGKLKKVDAYVGEIFQGSYEGEYNLLKPVIESTGGRVAIFRNHAKIYAGYGPKFSFGIEGSANINTNPRTENACITIGRDIFEFYKEYFDGIIRFTESRKKGKKELKTAEKDQET
jgi:hypothetical protein